MKNKTVLLLTILFLSNAVLFSQATGTELVLENIHIRDPFIVADKTTHTYYLYASIANRTGKPDSLQGVEVYKSKDLQNWESPKSVFVVPAKFWAHFAVWAPEVHKYKDKYYLFVTFTSTDSLPSIPSRPPIQKRGTQVLVADSPEGPFESFHNRSHTPVDWMALDGTLWIEDNQPYMIFCHEWIQITDGTIELVKLKNDLSDIDGKSVTLFNASKAPWVKNLGITDKEMNFPNAKGISYESYITDGPFLYKTKTGKLLMIWSSFGDKEYSVGIAESYTNKIGGPWIQHAEPLISGDAGHGMIFETFDGRLMLSLHQPNKDPLERARFIEIIDKGNTLLIKN